MNGFDGFGMLDLEGVEYMTAYTPMTELLGTDIYYDENVNGMEGLGQLGEPITLSSIAAAAGVIAGIVAMLKDVGNIFQKKTKEAEDFDEKKNEEADKENPVPVPPPTATPGIVPTVVTKTNTENADIPDKQLPVPTEEPANNVIVKSGSEPVVTVKNDAANPDAPVTNINAKDNPADNK